MSRRVNKTKDKRPGAQRDLTSLLEDMQIETPELQPQTQLTTADLFGAESTFEETPSPHRPRPPCPLPPQPAVFNMPSLNTPQPVLPPPTTTATTTYGEYKEAAAKAEEAKPLEP